MKVFIIFFFTLLVGCRKTNNQTVIESTTENLPPSQHEVIDDRLTPETKNYLERFKSYSKFRYYEDFFQSEKGKIVSDNIDNLINCKDNDYQKYYKEAIEIDPGILGIKSRLYSYGLYSALCDSIDKTLINNLRPEVQASHSVWEKKLGLKIFHLLKRVDQLPDSDDYIDFKIRIFQGAGRLQYIPDEMPEDENNKVNKLFYRRNREYALNYFRQFANDKDSQ